MKTIALIERGADGSYGIFTPDIDSTIIGEGITVAEAKVDFENSLAEVLAAYTDNGDVLPEELQNISFQYKYDLASFFDYYSFINVSKFAKLAGINASLMRQYKMGQYISEKQMTKIETALHNIGKELLDVKLV
ncbi:MAG: pilus assembly protein HicB [Bacteroidia bacterium]|nr:MAG: pilus assembly protein HicB [Bacteroidia bacterium]